MPEDDSTDDLERVGDRYRARRRVAGEKIDVAICDSYEEAEEALSAFAAATAESGQRTLRSWGERWLRRRETDGVHRSVPRERSVWSTHVERYPIADVVLRRLERRHVVQWVDALSRATAQTIAVYTGGRVERRDTGRRLSRSTVQGALALVRRSLSEAADLGYVRSNVALGVTVPRAPEDADAWDWLRLDEIARLLSLPVAPPRKRPRGTISLAQLSAVTTAIYTGIRAGVQWRLRWSDVHLDAARPELVARRTKGGRNRRVPLLPPVVEVLRAWRGQRPAIADALVWPGPDGPHAEGYDAGLRRLLRLAEIDRRVRWHDLRHTCGAHLIQGSWTARPATLWEVRDWLGHSSVTVTERYAHLAPEGLHALAGAPILPQLHLTTGDK